MSGFPCKEDHVVGVNMLDVVNRLRPPHKSQDVYRVAEEALEALDMYVFALAGPQM